MHGFSSSSKGSKDFSDQDQDQGSHISTTKPRALCTLSGNVQIRPNNVMVCKTKDHRELSVLVSEYFPKVYFIEEKVLEKMGALRKAPSLIQPEERKDPSRCQRRGFSLARLSESLTIWHRRSPGRDTLLFCAHPESSPAYVKVALSTFPHVDNDPLSKRV